MEVEKHNGYSCMFNSLNKYVLSTYYVPALCQALGTWQWKARPNLFSRCFQFDGKRDNKGDNFPIMVSAMKKVRMFKRRHGVESQGKTLWGRDNGAESRMRRNHLCVGLGAELLTWVFPVVSLCKYPAVSHLVPKENDVEKAVFCQRLTI